MKIKALLCTSIASILFCGIAFASQQTIRPTKSTPIPWFVPSELAYGEDYLVSIDIDAEGIYNLELTVDQNIKGKPSCAAKVEGCVLGTFVMQPGEKALCQPAENHVVYITAACHEGDAGDATAGTVRFFKK